MHYQEAVQLARQKESQQFLMFVSGRLVGRLSFHLGFTSDEPVGTVTYRSAEGMLETVFGAHVLIGKVSTFEARFPDCDLQPVENWENFERFQPL